MIEITSMDHNGRGISRINGKIVFVNNALPGEIVEIKTIEENKKYIVADVKKYIKKSENRIDSPCPYFEICGGCDIMHLSYKEQLEFKQNKIINIVNKYLDSNIKINKIIECNNNFYYRNKITFHVNNNIGFFSKHTNDIVKINKCLISNIHINNIIKELNKLNLKEISKITCRYGINELMIIIKTNNKNLCIDNLKNIAHSIYLEINNEYTLIYGKKYINEQLDKFKFILSPNSFFQVNQNVCLKLYKKIKEYVGTNKNILDLYCGIGSIGIFISEKNNVLGVEINKNAVKDATKNKEINKLNNINFICGDSGKEIKKLNFNPNIIIVDPPRNGLNKETINNILQFKCDNIIYISCDPMTMVRDLNILKNDYLIKEITPLDMFPNTKHVECITLLQKNSV